MYDRKEINHLLENYVREFGLTIRNGRDGIKPSDELHIFFDNGYMANIILYGTETVDKYMQKNDPCYADVPEDIKELYYQAPIAVAVCDWDANWDYKILNQHCGYDGKIWCFDAIDLKGALDEIRSLPRTVTLSIKA